jgi:hypothetical protein
MTTELFGRDGIDCSVEIIAHGGDDPRDLLESLRGQHDFRNCVHPVPTITDVALESGCLALSQHDR